MVTRPPLTPIDPGESETISFQVARFMTQMGSQEGDKPGPTLREIPVHEALAIEIEASWGETPFYPEPGPKRGRTDQLKRWERGILEARFDRPSSDAPPSQQGGESSR
jgi:hypothetical protein